MKSRPLNIAITTALATIALGVTITTIGCGGGPSYTIPTDGFEGRPLARMESINERLAKAEDRCLSAAFAALELLSSEPDFDRYIAVVPREYHGRLCDAYGLRGWRALMDEHDAVMDAMGCRAEPLATYTIPTDGLEGDQLERVERSNEYLSEHRGDRCRTAAVALRALRYDDIHIDRYLPLVSRVYHARMLDAWWAAHAGDRAHVIPGGPRAHNMLFMVLEEMGCFAE